MPGLDITYREGDLFRFLQTTNFLDRLNKAFIEKDWSSLSDLIGDKDIDLPVEFSSLPSFGELRAKAVKIAAGEKSALSDLRVIIKSLNEIFKFRINELISGNRVKEMQQSCHIKTSAHSTIPKLRAMV